MGKRRFGAWLLLGGVLLLAGADRALAQGTGVVTGTITDGDGVIPGVTVTAVDANTSVTRTAISNAEGVFRLLSMPSGRYTIRVEIEGFKQITIPDVALYTGETRDLGKLALQVGVRSETITVTAEVTPVQTATSALTRNITGDTLMSVQVKGRDIFGMMKILPGVVDTTASRDFAQWNSGRGLSINGGNSLNKNTTIDGVPVGEEGGDGTTHITPNIDAIGEVNVITSGYTAENGRQSSGLDQHRHQVGHQPVPRDRAGTTRRRDEWNKNDFFRDQAGDREAVLRSEHRRLQLRRPGHHPGCSTAARAQKKIYFFVSQEFTDDVRPTDVTPHEPADRPRARRRLLADPSTTAASTPTQRSSRPVIDPERASADPDGQPFPGNVIPRTASTRWARRCSTCCRCRTASLDPDGRTAFDLERRAGRHAAAHAQELRARASTRSSSQNIARSAPRRCSTATTASRSTASRRASARSTTCSRATCHRRVEPGAEPDDGQRDRPWASRTTTGASASARGLERLELHAVLQPNVVNPLTGSRASIRRASSRSASSATRHARHGCSKDEYPYLPDMRLRRRRPRRPGAVPPARRQRPAAAAGTRTSATRSRTTCRWTKGRHNFKFGFFIERDSKTEPGSTTTPAPYNFGHSADNPLSTGNGYANALLGVFTTLHRTRQPRRPREPALAVGRVRAGQLAHQLAVDAGLRPPRRRTHGAVYEARDMNSGFDPALWSAAQAAELYQPVCLERRRRAPRLRDGEPARA